jgi:heat shock protein HtpX
MAFNFWEAQRKARSRTRFYVMLFIILTLIVACGVEIAMRVFVDPDLYDPPLPYLGMLFAAITFGTALFNYSMYTQYGGRYVAESAGGVEVDPLSRDPVERQLLNIVREMAVAASVPMPAVYILPAREINAFAAGITQDKAAIAVTQGCLRLLNRSELQGVIAHEIGHIYNRDMRIGLQLAAMVMGFFVLMYVGFRILQIANLTGDRRGSYDDDRRGGSPVLVAGMIFILAGTITWFFGALLQSAVSRQREYLADACSVQFTRYPEGIASALRKIGQQTVSDMPRSGMAFSHMYFDESGGFRSLFATHPPLEKRIAAIEGLEYLPPEWKKDLKAPNKSDNH